MSSCWMPVHALPSFSGENCSTLSINSTSLPMQNHRFRCRMSGCTTSDSVSLSLLPHSTIITNNLFDCDNQVPFTLNGATPSGGTYFGNEIYNGGFHPNISNTGIYIYKYLFQVPNGGSSSASGNIQFSTCTDLQETTASNLRINIYPNPSN